MYENLRHSFSVIISQYVQKLKKKKQELVFYTRRVRGTDLLIFKQIF